MIKFERAYCWLGYLRTCIYIPEMILYTKTTSYPQRKVITRLANTRIWRYLNKTIILSIK